MTRIVLPAALLVAACALGACSSMSDTSKTLAANSGYHPKYLPASDVFAASEKSGRFGGATYVCGDRKCATAVRAD